MIYLHKCKIRSWFHHCIQIRRYLFLFVVLLRSVNLELAQAYLLYGATEQSYGITTFILSCPMRSHTVKKKKKALTCKKSREEV